MRDIFGHSSFLAFWNRIGSVQLSESMNRSSPCPTPPDSPKERKKNKKLTRDDFFTSLHFSDLYPLVPLTDH